MRKIEKLTKTLLAFAMMAGFAACSSDSDTGSNTPQGDRYLTLSISTKSVMRTTMIDSDPGSASEDAISSLTVGIFNDAGDAVKIEEFASSAFDTSSGTIQVVITTQAGPIEIKWKLTGGGTETQTFVVAASPTKRQRRLPISPW